MKIKNNMLPGLLSATAGLYFLAAMLLRAFLPRIILPKIDLSLLVIITLVSLLLEHYISKETKRIYWLLPIYGALVFGLFSWVACFADIREALKLAAIGAIVLTVITYLFDTMMDRLSTGPAAKIAPIATAFTIFLATQCLMGIF